MEKQQAPLLACQPNEIQPSQQLRRRCPLFGIETVSHEGLASDDGGAIAPSTQRPIVLGMANMTSEYIDGEPVYKLQNLASIAGSSEQLAEEFFEQIKQRRPKIVSFNGKVLMFQAEKRSSGGRHRHIILYLRGTQQMGVL